MSWKLDREAIPEEFREPVSRWRRMGDFAFLLLGLVCMFFTLRAGGAALLILPFGTAVTAAAIWLLLHSHRIRPPPAVASQLDDVLRRRLGQLAFTPQARADYIREYLSGALRLSGMIPGIWFAGFGVGRRSVDTYDAIAHFTATGSGVAVAVTPTTAGRFTVRVLGLTPTQRLYLKNTLDTQTTDELDFTDTQRGNAQEAHEIHAPSERQVEAFATSSTNAIAAVIELVYKEIVSLDAGYELTAHLVCRLPAWSIGHSER